MGDRGESVESSADSATHVDQPVAAITPQVGSATLTRDSGVTVTSPLEAIRNDEVERFRRLGFPTLAVAIVAILALLPFLPADTVARWIFGGGLVMYGAGAVWFRLKIRDPAQFRDGNLLVLGLTGVTAAFGAVYYWGVFSPAPIVVAAILFLNSMDGGPRHTALVYALCAVVQASVAGAIIVGAIDDRGLIRADSATLITQLVTQGAIQGALLLAFVGGRTLRRVTLESVLQLDRAAREASKREAVIDEIRQELARAAGVNVPGRFTDQVLGSFRLGHVIGRGGMGEVYEARHRDTGGRAAVKLLLFAHIADPEYRERFAREAAAALAIKSPHVVRVLELGMGSEIPFIAMELLEGSSLATLLQQRRQLPLDEVVDITDQVARGLEAARRQGIVHRDLKPHNLWLATDAKGEPTWKILDFGVAKHADQSGTLTQGAVIGTPAYMAPEQARGEDVDHRADVYGLGAIAYRALTGRAAFASKELAHMVHDIVTKMPMQPSLLAPVSVCVDAVLAIALCKEPSARFATALELAAAMRAASSGRVDDGLMARAALQLARLPWVKQHSAVVTAPG